LRSRAAEAIAKRLSRTVVIAHWLIANSASADWSGDCLSRHRFAVDAAMLH
jgi:hypothetical protein